MELEAIWEEHNSRVNKLIGKMSVVAARNGGLAREAHQELIDLSIWFDEQMEEVEAEQPKERE